MERDAAPIFRLALEPSQVADEVRRLEGALAASREQLAAIKERLSREVGAPHAYIFDAHLLMLDDPLLRDRAAAIVRDERVNAEWALRSVSESLHALFSQFSDAYLRERSTDLDDVIGRVQLNLRGSADAPSLERLPGPVVLVAGDLTPSEAAELDWERVLAIVTDVGSSTYHTAIIARSLGIPAIAGLKGATRQIPPGSLLVVDGTRGERRRRPFRHGARSLPQGAGGLSTRRGAAARDACAAGANRWTASWSGSRPTSSSPRRRRPHSSTGPRASGSSARSTCSDEGCAGRARSSSWTSTGGWSSRCTRIPVTVRTWDVGLEAFGPAGPASPNPALGERALRLLRRSPEPFRVQLRALLRAGRYGPVRIMFPFVSGPGDLRLALALLDEARAELRAEGVEFREDVPVGVNLEVPSAAVVADLLAAEVDFFSVGTNDLIQYLLAVDRTDPRVSGLYEPLHPAVLRTLAQIARAALVHERPLSVCGEMAGHPVEAVLLVGLGYRELSMAPSAIPRVKAALRAVSAADGARPGRALPDAAHLRGDPGPRPTRAAGRGGRGGVEPSLS